MNGTPVLMVTSVVEKAKILEAIKAGVSDYLIKPFNAVELQNKIKNLFQSHQPVAFHHPLDFGFPKSSLS